MSDGDPKTVSSSEFVSFGNVIEINSKRELRRFSNGASKAYDAYDKRDKSKKYIAIVSDVSSLARWRDVPTYEKLLETSFMRLIGTGIVRWPSGGGQRYVFMYDGGVGDCLLKSGAMSKTTWRHPDIVSYLITPMVRILKEMKDKGFNHGSIRPDNIFYSSRDVNAPIVLGDGLSVQSLSTQPSLYLPVDKAMAEPMGRGRGSIADDIYAFGVSLAMFFRKNDELKGLSDEDIVRRKIEIGSYATIIGNERFQASFLEFLRGVLHDDATQRWGVEELFAWIDGARLSPPANIKRIKANRPYSFCGNKYLYTDVLAIDLHKNPEQLANAVEDGSLMQWVERSLNSSPTLEAFSLALERADMVRNDCDYLAFQVSIALNPRVPIYYKGRTFTYDGLGSLLATASKDGQNLSFFKDVLNLNILDHALAVKSSSQGELLANIKLFDTCRSSLKQRKPGFGVERCIYILCPNASCLSPLFDGYFVYGNKSALKAYEMLSQSGGQIALYLDQHAIAFFSLAMSSVIDRSMADLNSSDKARKINGNLRFLAALQRRAKIDSLPAIAGVMRDALSSVYKMFKNKKLREGVRFAVDEAARAGDLVTMSALMDDESTLTRDQVAFERAKQEYRLLQQEYNEYNKRLANKETYGIVNGRDAASVIAWLFSTVLTLLSVFAFFSGYEIF